jgi:hypothetical protein
MNLNVFSTSNDKMVVFYVHFWFLERIECDMYSYFQFLGHESSGMSFLFIIVQALRLTKRWEH